MKEMLVPLPWNGMADDVPHPEMQWLKNLPSNTYCALWQRWPDTDLPLGHDLYVVSFYLEPVDIEWLDSQCKKIDSPIIVLSDSNFYERKSADNLYCFTYYYWHHQLEKILGWYPENPTKKISYKFSSICNRVTQSKVLVTTMLLEHARNDSMIKLGNWIEPKNLHYNSLTNRKILDQVMDVFNKKYSKQTIVFDDFDNTTDNFQRHTCNPLIAVLQHCALHFTNESFHYSYHQEANNTFLYPGPFLTEKTLKCLVAECGFVAVGQSNTYHTLEKLGFKFDYGFDTSWDQLSGDLDRLERILDLIKNLLAYTATEIFEMTVDSSKHNRAHIQNGDFGYICRTHNDRTVNDILERFAT